MWTSSCLYSPLAGLVDTDNLTFLDKSWQCWQTLNELTIQDVQLSELTKHHLLSSCQNVSSQLSFLGLVPRSEVVSEAVGTLVTLNYPTCREFFPVKESVCMKAGWLARLV